MRMRPVRSRLGAVSAVALTLVIVACAQGTDSVIVIDDREGGPDADRDVVVIPDDSSSGKDTGPKPVDDSGACVQKVVINELKTDGPGANDEFVELYNPSTCAVPLGNWAIKYESAGGGAGGAGYTFPAGDYREKQTAPSPVSGKSIGRSSDGVDTDDNRADFKAFTTPNPRGPN